nr:protein argonaute-2-like [Cherax quadricarinatus]
MTITEPVENLSFRDSSSVDPEELFKELKQKYPKIQMIILIIQKLKEFYGKVKKAGDRTVGIITQCVTDGNVKNVKPVIVGNLLLKINAKLGGINTILDVDSRPVVFKHPIMIMGADVNHAPASDTVTPSLAAVVATRDVFASKYSTEVRHQTSRRDIIVELKEMTQNLLRAFYGTTGRKPEKIVMYRDGVSESEFQKVLSEELIAMRQACTALEENYTPAMTFVVVQKRHHTRLFCDESEGRGRSRNIPPGTTVDTVITHPSERDFYLSSHLGIQGTSRPTHYHVLWDDNDLSMNVLQSLTYAMCYLYSRCTRSVSIPTPTYYAHLGAYRGKVHIQDLCPSETSSLVSGEEEAYTDADVTNAAKMDSRKSEMASKLYYV